MWKIQRWWRGGIRVLAFPRGAWAESLRDTDRLQLGEVSIYAIHDLAQLDIEPAAEGIGVVISGHSDKPRLEERDGVLFVNPGSAGRRRFKLPISVGELIVVGGSVSARTVELTGLSAP